MIKDTLTRTLEIGLVSVIPGQRGIVMVIYATIPMSW